MIDLHSLRIGERVTIAAGQRNQLVVPLSFCPFPVHGILLTLKSDSNNILRSTARLIRTSFSTLAVCRTQRLHRGEEHAAGQPEYLSLLQLHTHPVQAKRACNWAGGPACLQQNTRSAAAFELPKRRIKECVLYLDKQCEYRAR